MALFPIFWKKNWKKSVKKFPKKFFFFTKICFSELEKAYVQLFVLNFFFLFSAKREVVAEAQQGIIY